ncbi:hypothetical protein BB65665_10660 [Bacillus sp. 916]|nr:hypothetical protein BB65665_10660 [Bacillus sp. 916]
MGMTRMINISFFLNGVFMGLCDAFVLLGKQELKQKVRIQI